MIGKYSFLLTEIRLYYITKVDLAIPVFLKNSAHIYIKIFTIRKPKSERVYTMSFIASPKETLKQE
jgi:hypothetical protein